MNNGHLYLVIYQYYFLLQYDEEINGILLIASTVIIII